MVVEQRDRRLFGCRRGAVEGLGRDGAAGRGIDHLLQRLDVRQPLEQLQRCQGIVIVIHQRVVDRRLVPVEAGKVVGVVEI
ncbi:MAG TPA: hypothetical protein VMS38_21615, partial [Pseudorhodoferax sp.]|nr:hypothetical protein [Pseudorhodoferax sp.]